MSFDTFISFSSGMIRVIVLGYDRHFGIKCNQPRRIIPPWSERCYERRERPLELWGERKVRIKWKIDADQCEALSSMLSIDFKVRETSSSEKSADIVRRSRHLTIYRKSRERKIVFPPCAATRFSYIPELAVLRILRMY